MKTTMFIVGLLGFIGSLFNSALTVASWLMSGYSIFYMLPFVIMGAIAAWLCLTYAIVVIQLPTKS